MLKEKIVNINDLKSEEIERMFQLMNVHYENVKQNKFERDCSEKDGVLLVYNLGKIVGFSTYQMIKTVYRNQTINAFFSGDTVLHKDYWGKTYVYKIAGSIFKMLLDKNSDQLYWFLITKGYKTYLYLPLLFNRFYPSYKECTPKYDKELIDHLSLLKFGDRYNSVKGVIVEHADWLIPEYNNISRNKMKNRHVEHFTKLNQGFRKGEELACITKVENDNLTALGKRFIHSDV